MKEPPSNPASSSLATVLFHTFGPRDKLAAPKLFVYVVARGKCYMIFQLTITITVDISVDNNNCPFTDQLLKR